MQMQGYFLYYFRTWHASRSKARSVRASGKDPEELEVWVELVPWGGLFGVRWVDVGRLVPVAFSEFQKAVAV